MPRSSYGFVRVERGEEESSQDSDPMNSVFSAAERSLVCLHESHNYAVWGIE